MWECPKCGRKFQRMNQSHYCGSAPSGIEEYIVSQPEEARAYLREITTIIQNRFPDIKGTIKWSMPSFSMEKCSLQLAACKHHISLYVGANVIETLESQFEGITYKKDALYIPYNQPLPVKLIETAVELALGKE